MDGVFGLTKESSNLIDPVVIPDKIAHIIKVALYAEYRRYRLKEDKSKKVDDEYRFKIINGETKEKCFKIGCHTFVAYLMGIVDLDKEGDYIWKDAEPFFDRDEYQFFDNVEDPNNYVVKSLGNEKFGVKQALTKGTKKLHHSFLVGVSVSGKDILSIEKENVGISPFKIMPLKMFFNGEHFNKKGDRVDLKYSIKSFLETKNILKNYSKIKNKL